MGNAEEEFRKSQAYRIKPLPEPLAILECLNRFPEPHRTLVEAEVRVINSKLIEQKLDKDETLRGAYDALAEGLSRCGTLSNEEVHEGIPVLVFEVALELGWLTRQEAECDSFFRATLGVKYGVPSPVPEPAATLGRHRVQEGFRTWLLAKLSGRMEHWRAVLLRSVAEKKTSVEGGVQPRVTARSGANERVLDPIVALRPQGPLPPGLDGGDYPRHMFHATHDPRLVFTEAEEQALGSEWSRTYIYKEYPKLKYHWSGKTAVVKNAEEETALGGGWANNPSEFDPYKDPPRCWKHPLDSTKWVADWPPSAIPGVDPELIKAAILDGDASFWRDPTATDAAIKPMQLAYRGVAQVLFDAGVLTNTILTADLPALIWDSAIAGGWWHLASETRRDIFPEQIGHYWVWRDDSRDWDLLFRAETSDWSGALIRAKAKPSGPAAPAPASKGKQSHKYEQIDLALRSIAQAHPKNHEEVFRMLLGRAPVPDSEPFKSARGWCAGFEQDPTAARAWLSKHWSRLDLPPFQRGPK